MTDLATGNSAADPASLDRLHDLVMPAPMPWWPPAPGWYLLGALLLALAGFAGVRALLRWRADAYRRTALAELNVLAESCVEGGGADFTLNHAAEILKRTALVAFPRSDVAGLSGERWIDWLNRTGNGAAFQGETARLLACTIYKPGSVDALTWAQWSQVLGSMRHWIKRHRSC